MITDNIKRTRSSQLDYVEKSDGQFPYSEQSVMSCGPGGARARSYSARPRAAPTSRHAGSAALHGQRGFFLFIFKGRVHGQTVSSSSFKGWCTANAASSKGHVHGQRSFLFFFLLKRPVTVGTPFQKLGTDLFICEHATCSCAGFYF